MRYGIMFSIMAFGLFWHTSEGGWRLVFAWPALSLAIMGVAYLIKSPAMVGKRLDGSLRLPQALLIFPYLALIRVAWLALRYVRKGESYDEVWPRIIVGRRLLGRERLAEVDCVVDLTCEFEEPANILRGIKYLALPTLDQTAPEAEALLEVVNHCLHWKGTIYIHCAEGHGRAGTVAVCLAIARGDAESLEAATAFVSEHRRGTRLTRTQQGRVVEVLPRLFALRDDPGD